MKTGTINWLLYGGIPLAGLIAPVVDPVSFVGVAVARRSMPQNENCVG